MIKTLKLSTAIISVLALLLCSTPAYAHNGEDDAQADDSRSSTSKRGSETEQEKDRLTRAAEAKEKTCGVKKTKVSTLETKVGNRGQGRLDAITKISTKVQAYVTDKNLTVANYDSLVGDINAKKATAQAAVNKVKSEVGSVGSVHCQGGDGKAQVETFKKDMRAQQSALKAYRQSVKALVAAVKVAKTATGETQQ